MASKVPLYVGLDVGGTSMKAGVVDEEGQALSGVVNVPTEPERGQEKGLQRMCEAIEGAMQAAGVALADITAIGVATPGTMDLAAGLILDPPNLKPWRNVPVRQYIQDHFQRPTAFQNDANAAAYGEFWMGAGQHVHSLVLYTLGTGIGGGIIIDDLIVEGEHSHGAELGHVRIDLTNPRLCHCGRYGCLEAYASATHVVLRTQEALQKSDASSPLAALPQLTARDVFEAASAGDALADKIVEDTAFYLAVGAANMMHTIDPDMVAFAGGMTAAGDMFLHRIQKYVKELAFPVPAARTEICFARLGSDAGYIGAAGCARLLMKQRLRPTGQPTVT